MTGVASREGSGLVHARVAATPLLSATGIEKSYRRGDGADRGRLAGHAGRAIRGVRGQSGDRRLALAGLRTGRLLTVCLGVLGLAQSPMLRSSPPGLAHLLPGYGAYGVLLDGALTAHFDETRAPLIGLLWLTGLAVAATLLFRPAVPPAAIHPLEA